MKKTVLFFATLLTCMPSTTLRAYGEQYGNESDKSTERATSFIAATGISATVLAYRLKQNLNMSLGNHILHIILSAAFLSLLPESGTYWHLNKRETWWGLVLPPLAYICSKAF